MESSKIRELFLQFFKKRGHAIIPSASLIPEHDPSVLFTSAGMQPLVPYLLGQKHPQGSRLADVQKCLRTQDIGEIGDQTHLTFFEMLGNWSLGDYFKKEAIAWSYEFLTDAKEGLGLDPARLSITCFAGDSNAPKDEESAFIWEQVGIPKDRIYFLGADSNWWSPGDNGPCGPDTEMFYDVTKDGLGNLSLKEFQRADKEQQVIEVWNNVFMEYEKKSGRVIGKLKQKNVDTGMGLERITAVMQNKENVFETDLFSGIIHAITDHIEQTPIENVRIIADHLRAATFIVADGVRPSNVDRGYVLRRLIRRAMVAHYICTMSLDKRFYESPVQEIVHLYGAVQQYAYMRKKEPEILQIINQEVEKFSKTLERGLKEIQKETSIDAKKAFHIYQTYGFPLEMIEEEAQKKGITIDRNVFYAEMQKHQTVSRVGSEQKFKGGLADHSDQAVKYHTATHLLHQALRNVLGVHVLQKGSNITQERMRFDFTHPQKLTEQELKKVENIVNKQIQRDLKVTRYEMTVREAKQAGAIGIFDKKYSDKVSVYTVGDFSKEICGGPHVTHTAEIGKFAIIKEEGISAGIRRIRAVVQ